MLSKSIINQVQELLGWVAMTQLGHFFEVTPQMCQTFLLGSCWVAVVHTEVIAADNAVKLKP